MKRKTVYLSIVALLLLSLTLSFTAACSTTPQTEPEEKVLRIGYASDMSGFLSVYYIGDTKNLELTADYINEMGGVTIQGEQYMVELVGEDTKSTMDGALAAANRLVYDDKVKFVIGPTSFEGQVTTPVFEENKVLHVLNYAMCTPTEIGPDTPYAFVGDHSAVGFASVIFKAAQKEFPDIKNVVIVGPDDGTLPYLMPKFKLITDQLGYNILNDGNPIGFPNDLEDFSPISAKINALNPDAVFVTSGAPSHMVGIIKGLRALGNDVPFAGVFPGVDMASLIPEIGTEAATNIIGATYDPNDPYNPPIMKALIERQPEGSITLFNQGSCLYILTQVIQEANSLDPDVVKATWESMETCEAIYGTGIFCGELTYGLPNHAVATALSYKKIMNGEIQSLPYSTWIDYGPLP
jgi:branched-chain amino acid transport system substrate-binding protein